MSQWGSYEASPRALRHLRRHPAAPCVAHKAHSHNPSFHVFQRPRQDAAAQPRRPATSAHNCTISTKSIQPMAHTFCTSTHTAHKWPSHTPRTTTIHLAAPAAPRRAGIASNGHIIGLAPLTMHICQARPTAHGHTARPTRAARYGRTPHDPTPPAWRTYTANLSNLSNLSKLSNLSNLSSAVAPPPE